MIKHSIIIPTFNKCNELLLPCIESILKYTDLRDTEILVSANGCTDNTREYVESLHKKHKNIRLVWSKKRLGYPRAVNKGIKAAKGEYIIPLNNDTVLLPQEKNAWIDILKKPFLEDDKVGLTGPMKTHSPSAGRDFLIFFCVMIHRKVINKIGLLDESFGDGYGEDTAFCLDAEDVGFKVMQVPAESQIYYAEKRMTGDFPIFHDGNRTFENWEGGEELLAKNNKILERYKVKTQKAKMQVDISKALTCDGYMAESELMWLANTAQSLPKNSTLVEIGSWHGRSSRAIGDNLSEGSVLYCVDTWQGSVIERDTNHASAKQMNGDHAFYEFLQNNIDLVQKGKIIPLRISSTNAAAFFLEKNISFDFAFIDAGHSYEEILEDIDAWTPLVKDDAILSGHDYNHPNGVWEGVGRAVRERFDKIENPPYTSIWKIIKEKERTDSKVFDCFPFFNELDILEIRFNELYDVVDRFIICEATLTHGGQPKPLYFKENLHKFQKFLHKVTHIVVDDYPAKDSWSIERHQRDCLMRGLGDCKNNDIIIISDCDEIPSAETIKNYKPSLGIRALQQKLYYYNFNCKAKDLWQEGKILTYKELKKLTPCGARYHKCEAIKNAGWHFSYFKDIDGIVEKIRASAHQEYNKPEFTDKKRIQEAVKKNKDLFGRGLKYAYAPFDKTHPEYVKKNKQKFSKYIVKSKTKENAL